MLQSIAEIIAEAAEASAGPTARQTFQDVVARLDWEIQSGLPAASRNRTKTALVSLLKTRGKTPEGEALDLTWFDREFPLDGWNPVTMRSLSQASYLDYRKRARAAIERTIGVAQQRQAFRKQVDGWSEVGEWLTDLPDFGGRQSRRLIPVKSTLTNAAQRRALRPQDITQEHLLGFHNGTSVSGERKSLRDASALVAILQANPDRKEIWTWFPHPISPIQANGNSTYDLPDHFVKEIEDMIERAARLSYVRVKKTWTYVGDRTRSSYRETLRSFVAALMATGHLRRTDNRIADVLESEAALTDALGHWLHRFEKGELASNTIIQYAGRLPAMFDRLGFETGTLRELISETEEFCSTTENRQMADDTKEFCKALIERLDFRNDFLMSHTPPRRAATEILTRAKKEGRSLTASEIVRVRQLGTVSLFCALEVGGAPIRVRNFLLISIEGLDAWLKAVSSDRFELSIPAARTKNKKRIWAPIMASREKYHDTVVWFMKHIRPLFLTDPETGAVMPSAYLVPGIKDPTAPLPYDTFRSWFISIMRDICGIVCTPHNFRHGQASLLYYFFPQHLSRIAHRLGDAVSTVLEHYAWIHEEHEMERGQEYMVRLINESRPG